MTNTYQEMELVNGEKIKLTLTLKEIQKLSSIDNELYKKVDRIAAMGVETFFEDVPTLLYGAYVSALEDKNTRMDYSTFLDLIPQSIKVLSTYCADLVNGKKTTK